MDLPGIVSAMACHFHASHLAYVVVLLVEYLVLHGDRQSWLYSFVVFIHLCILWNLR